MILLLDASSHSFRYRQLHLLGYGPRSEEIGIRLSYLLFYDLKLELLQSIDFIVLINLDSRNLDHKIVTRFNENLYFRSKCSIERKEYERLLQTLRIFNYQDLGLELDDLAENKLIDEKFISIWSKHLKALLKDCEVMLLGEWISQYSVLLLEQLPKIKLFKKYFFSFDERTDNGFYEVIEDREKYIKYYKSFYINRISENKNPDYYKYLDAIVDSINRNPFKNIKLLVGNSSNRFHFKYVYSR